MPAFNQYYQDELAYLRSLGAQFATENPETAAYLARDSQDPDVERLLEGFAFLTARLRERLDEELPELSHNLLAVLWPQALRPTPCTSILAFDPIPGVLTETARVPRGVEVQSQPIEGASCTFKTCFATDIQPLRLTSAALEELAGRSVLKLQIAPLPGIKLDQVDLGRLRLFINTDEDPASGRELRLLLRQNLRGLGVRTADNRGFELPAEAMRPVGLDAEESILPVAGASFDGFRLLQEYLTLPQKFLFLDIVGLPAATSFVGTGFTLIFEFDRTASAEVRFHQDQIRLNCVPIVNLYDADGEPLLMTRRASEYRLLAPGQDQGRARIYTVNQVTGWPSGRSRAHDYVAYESFRQLQRPELSYYRLRRRPSVIGLGYDTYLSFVDGRERPLDTTNETIVAGLTCCNGSLPELLPVGAVDRATTTSPDQARFRTIARMTPYVDPPLNATTFWSVITLMSRNYRPLADLDGLRALLSHLDFRAVRDLRAQRRRQLMGEALQSIATRPLDALIKGLPVRGREIEIHIDESRFGGRGEAFLFGEVLNDFLGLFAGINACHRLTLHCINQNIVFTWPVRSGSTRPI